MRLVKHMADVVWLGVWRRLAILGIGDPLNQLLFVAPYSIVTPEKTRTTRYKVVTPKPAKGGQKALRRLVGKEFVDERKKAHLTTGQEYNFKKFEDKGKHSK
jgi:hypothetical protein